MNEEEQSPRSKHVAFGEPFDFGGHKFIVISEVAEGFVLAVKADDQRPAPIYLLPAPQPEVNQQQQNAPQQKSHPTGKEIRLWTNGSCLGNPGPGGWAYVWQEADGVLSVASGGEQETTMMRMKIRAVIEALNALPQRESPLVVYSDSQLIIKTMADGWPPKMDFDIWEELKRATRGLSITWQPLEVGAVLPETDRCSRLAEAAAAHQARARGRRPGR